jgi:hypothetical protein
MRWKWCSDAKDVGELELEGGCNSSRLLGLGIDGSNARLKGCEGSGEVGQSGYRIKLRPSYTEQKINKIPIVVSYENCFPKKDKPVQIVELIF